MSKALIQYKGKAAGIPSVRTGILIQKWLLESWQPIWFCTRVSMSTV